MAPGTAAEWTPQVRITPELVAPVLAEQFPQLAGLPVRAFDAGWDNAVLRAGERWVLRFVHRAIAVDGARREVAVLTALRGRLPLPVPDPLLVGTPTDAVPWPFWGGPMLPGRGLAESGLAMDRRVGIARQVGEFLRVLHDPELAAHVTAAVAVPLPVDPNGRSDPAGVVVPRARARLERLARALPSGVVTGARTWTPSADVQRLLADAESLAAPVHDEPVLVHGDLHVRHVLVAEDRVTGIIDWGDVALADPCVDLMLAWSAFEGAAREALLEAYGPVPADRELRARATAVSVGAALAEQAATDGQAGLLAEALAAVDRAASDR